MTRFASKGSQRWLQIAIESRPALLDAALSEPLGLRGKSIDWRSPKSADRFNEYRDQSALRLLGVELSKRALSDFWPARGPVWDALGVSPSGEPIFVEAKAHVAEAASPPSKASPVSKKKIDNALREARHRYAPRSKADWSSTFYQYANRLAHHYLLREVNGVRSHLAFVYFTNARDVNGPTSIEEWRGAIRLLHVVLGVSERTLKGVHEVFLDVSALV